MAKYSPRLQVKLQMNLPSPLSPLYIYIYIVSRTRTHWPFSQQTRCHGGWCMVPQLWHSVAVAGGTTLADAAEVGAQLVPLQARWFFPGAVGTRRQPALVTRRVHATARTTVQGISFYVAERVTDGGPVHRLRYHGTAQMRVIKTLNCFSARKTLQSGGSGFVLIRYRHCINL